MSKLVEGKHVKCSRCSSEAIVRVTYAKLNLCKNHFLEYLESRVVESAKRYGIAGRAKSVLVALSGGKDSLSLARILARRRSELGLEVVYGFHLDLGLGEYSKTSKKLVEKLCGELGLKCLVLELKSLTGYSLPELVQVAKRPACSLCGMVKRYFVNLVAVELGVDAAVLGHHMDDLLVFALKNFLLQVEPGYLKLAPVARGIPGVLAPRFKMLYEVYESDLKLYAELSGIDYVKVECPYKYVDAFSAAIRDMLNSLEEHSPGFKISLARKLAKRGVEEPPPELLSCKYCGMPSSGTVCAFCRLTERVVGKPMGPEVRYKIREVTSRLLA